MVRGHGELGLMLVFFQTRLEGTHEAFTITSLLPCLADGLGGSVIRECSDVEFGENVTADLHGAPAHGEYLCWASIIERSIRGVLAVYASMSDAATFSNILARTGSDRPRGREEGSAAHDRVARRCTST